jgi:DNA-binding transcriptional LysR family regulator
MEVFNALMRNGTTTAAAEALSISQPGVSKALKHLEAQIGVQLFKRVGGRLLPTPEAQTLYGHVRNVFARIETIERVSRDLRGGQGGVISVACTPSIAGSILASAAVRLRARHPTCQIIFRTLTSHQVAHRVAFGEADFGVVHSPVDHVGLQTEAFKQQDIACIVPADHPLAGRPAVGLRDLMPYPLISYRPGTRIGSRINEAFRAEGLDKEIDFQTSLSSTACVLAIKRAGVALTDTLAIEAQHYPDLAVVPVLPAISIHLQLVFARTSPSSGLALKLVDELRAIAAEQSAPRNVHAIRLAPVAEPDGRADREVVAARR